MIDDRNPQAEQMADESMIRTLAAQAEAIWPQERLLLERYGLPPDAVIADVGCGTGEITGRLAELFPRASIVGVDIHPDHVERARERWSALADRVRFAVGDAFALDLPDAHHDLTLCRHLVQAVPRPDLVAGELLRITRPGGVVHVVAEDYGMMHFHPTRGDTDRFWRDGPITFAERTGTDLRVGRKMPAILRKAGFRDVRVEYVVIDTTRVPRGVFADIWIAWRDGYAAAIAEGTELELPEILNAFEDMISAIRSPDGYAVWQLPIVSGRAPSP